MARNQLKGVVVSNKMDKTVVVEVENVKKHPIYTKRYKFHKKYKAHDENNEHQVGDKVTIEESRPMSKDKKWKIVSVKSETKNLENKEV